MAQGDNAPDFYGVTNVVGSCTGIPLSLIFLRLQTERETGAFLGCNKPLNTPLDCTGSVKNCVQHAKQAAISRMFTTHYYWPQSENFEFMNAPLWAIEELSLSTKPFDLQCRPDVVARPVLIHAQGAQTRRHGADVGGSVPHAPCLAPSWLRGHVCQGRQSISLLQSHGF